MRKFKLKKEYPNSLKLGSVLVQDELGQYITVEGCLEIFERKDVENYPEFWEEVIEKEYEILSLQGNQNNASPFNLIPIVNGKVYATYSLEDHIFKYSFHGNSHIYSVKRLSDGEVFTLGDMVKTDDLTKFKVQTITAFLANPNSMVCQYENGTVISLSKIRKVKKALFTTEDGTELFEGDEFYWLDKNLNSGHSTDKDIDLYFSTKEKAEEYIIMNKPCLSIKDLLKSKCVFYQEDVKKLKQLVRRKLK